MGENKKKFRVNIFDIVIIVVVIVLVAGFYVFTHKDAGSAVNTEKMTYVIEINKAVPGMEDNIQIGSKLVENTKNHHIGEVKDFEVVPYTKITPDFENNIYRDSVDPTCNRVLLTVEADVAPSGNSLAVDGQFVVRAGMEIFVKGEGFAGEGYVVEIKR